MFVSIIYFIQLLSNWWVHCFCIEYWLILNQLLVSVNLADGRAYGFWYFRVMKPFLMLEPSYCYLVLFHLFWWFCLTLQVFCSLLMPLSSFVDRALIENKLKKVHCNHTGDAEIGIPILSVICPVTILCIRSFIIFLFVSVHGVRSFRSSQVMTFLGGS